MASVTNKKDYRMISNAFLLYILRDKTCKIVMYFRLYLGCYIKFSAQKRFQIWYTLEIGN